jgi:hypothetical protein
MWSMRIRYGTGAGGMVDYRESTWRNCMVECIMDIFNDIKSSFLMGSLAD